MRESRYILPPEEIEALELRIKECRDSDRRNRLLCVYWVGKGKSVEWVSDFFLMSVRTVLRYLHDYYEHNKIDPGQKGGSKPLLNEAQEKELKNHLSKTIVRSTIEIVDYVQTTFGVKYSRGGMAKWLLRQGFRYKRPHRVPHTVSIAKQEAFVELYGEMKASLKEDEVILFMDGVHPDHQTQAVCGWIQVGMNAQVPSTSKQKRLHYMGAVEIFDDHVVHTVIAYDRINSQSVIDFLEKLKAKYPGKKLKIICDQGAYHTSKETKKYLENNPWVKLIYLPPRCPNLNLIERLWKLMREHVTYNRYYAHFCQFKDAVENFFHSTLHTLSNLVAKRLKDNFQIVKPSFMTL
jgi:transposase